MHIHPPNIYNLNEYIKCTNKRVSGYLAQKGKFIFMMTSADKLDLLWIDH